MKNQLTGIFGASRIGVGAAFVALCAFSSVSRAQIVDNLTTASAVTADPSSISGVKNAEPSMDGQGFETVAGGYLSGLTLDLALKDENGGGHPVSTTETMTISLYAATQSGANAGNFTGSPLETFATLSEANIEGSTPLGYAGPGNGNPSDIYQYTVNLNSANDTYKLLPDTTYSIVIGISDSGDQSMGWAEETGGAAEPAGEVGEMDVVDGYGRMEVGGLMANDNFGSVPDSASTALLLGGVLSGFVFLKRKMA